MEKRSIFALNGITGMLIATVLLLSIHLTLIILAVGAQKESAQDYYYIENAKDIKMFGSNPATHMKTLEVK